MVGVFVALFLLYGLSPVLARALSNFEVRQTEPKNDYHLELAVVNLPVGERFVAYGPVIEGFQTYVTEKRPMGERPRRLTIFRPGMTTMRSWEVYIYIQEH